MPLQRISIVAGRDAASREAVGGPADDRFQIISEHGLGMLVCAPEYLGIQHGRAPVFIQITLNRRRTLAQEEALYGRLPDLLHETANVPRADVIVNLVEVSKEDWSFGDGV